MKFSCCTDERRTAVINHPLLNGIDFLEVVDNPSDPDDVRQTVLLVHFLKDLAQGELSVTNIIIQGGERIQHISVKNVSVGLIASPLSPPTSPPESNNNILVVQVDQAGDFSTYTLKVVQDAGHLDPPAGFDPILSSVDFSFKVLCPSDFDCSPSCSCTPAVQQAPDINYLAKDYTGFRQLMLDRMALLFPQWRENNAADPGVMLVELLAWVGDYLSYRQDAIATEAYLGTARKRISVRRHARLVDYYMHDGCNARTWAHIEVADGITGLPLLKEVNGIVTKVLTKSFKLPNVLKPDNKEFNNVVNDGSVEIFELMHDTVLDARHNTMYFYTWAQKNCCLPKGATSATLDTHLPALQVGQILIFQEVLGPRTGKPGDADPKHRHAVRLTEVNLSSDPIGFINSSPPQYAPRPVTEITWSDADALPFPLCTTSDDDDGNDVVVSVVLGNNVLVDHGLTFPNEPLPTVPDPANNDVELNIVEPGCSACEKSTITPIAPRYYPTLKKGPLTQAASYDTDAPPTSAAATLQWEMKDVLPAIRLEEQNNNSRWLPLIDLISSNANDKNFVAEVEGNGVSYLRFGNDIQGKRPSSDVPLDAVYRVGNGLAGNIGAQALKHMVSSDGAISNDSIVSITNPLAAVGGLEAETIELVRKRAPIAFRTQKRAVTMRDYEDVSRICSPDIQRSAATLRWTGSWRTVFLTVDRLGGAVIKDDFETQLRNCIEKYRMAGQDLEVENPVFVSLQIDITVCVLPDYFRSQVKSALLNVLSNRQLPDGSLGVFHPDNFSFGQPVYLSPIYTALQKVPGVGAVTITKFQRQGKDTNEALLSGTLLIGRTEIARLDNDPNFPEHGVFNLTLEGGK